MSRAARERGDLGDRIDHPLRILRRRPHHQHGVVVDRRLHRRRRRHASRPHRDATALQTEVVAALLERRVSAGRQHHVGCGDAELPAAAFTRRLHRHQDALGATRCHEPGALVAGIQPFADDRDDLGLDRAQARERIGVERFSVEYRR